MNIKYDTFKCYVNTKAYACLHLYINNCDYIPVDYLDVGCEGNFLIKDGDPVNNNLSYLCRYVVILAIEMIKNRFFFFIQDRKYDIVTISFACRN